MKGFKHKNIKYVSVDEFNDLLIFCKNNREIKLYRYDKDCGEIGNRAYLFEYLCRMELTFCRGDYRCTYITRLDSYFGQQQVITGLDAFTILSRYYKVPRRDEGTFSASPFLWYNEKYDKQRHYAYEYDINSAYASVMFFDEFPDTTLPPYAGEVHDNEIGFNIHGDIVTTGRYAPYVFPKTESPFKRFAERWFLRRYNAPKGSEEREKAKEVINYSVGYLQIVNKFLRAYIVNRCNEIIESLINDDYIIHCNTDCIVSLKPLPLELGDGIGKWKVRSGCYAYIGHNYQWNDELPSYRGTPKGWFTKGWNLLKDDLPEFGNTFYFDRFDFLIKKVDKYK